MINILGLTLSYILGIVSFHNEITAYILPVLALIIIILNFKKIISYGVSLLFIFMFCFGFLNTNLHTKNNDKLGELGRADKIELAGRIVSPPQSSLNKTRLKFYLESNTINNEKQKEKSKTIVSINNLEGNFKDIRIGDEIECLVNLRNPINATNPSQFDYKKYLKHKNTFSTAYVIENNYKVTKAPKIKINQPISENIWAVIREMDVIRDKIIEKHSKYIQSPKLEVLGGIVFGDDAVNPPDDIKQTFIDSGLLHLLAASGFNVGIIFMMWYFVAQKLHLGFRPTIISSIFLILLYTFMTGFPPSILRASIMLLFVLIGKLIHRDVNTLNLILFVGLLLLIFNPNMLFDVGFELSFLVTSGLIICTDSIINLVKTQELAFQNKHQKDHPLLKKIIKFTSPAYLIGILSVPLVAQIWVMPLQMYYFNTFTPYSILANIIVVPIVAVISFLGFIGSVLGMIPFVSDIILKVTDFIISPFAQALLNVSSYFASMPYSKITTFSPNIIQILAYYIFIIAFFLGLKKKFRLKKEKVFAIITFVIFALSLVKIPNNNFEITFFDVGNADSFLIKTPNDKYIMIDTGKIPYRSNSTVKGTALEYLKDKGIKNLEILILTHFDDDHVGGTLNILDEINVKNIYITENKCDTKTSCDILNQIKENHKIAQDNETIFKDKDLEIKTFKADFSDNRNNKNESSIITEIDYKNTKSLFMGDAGIKAYEKLKNELPKNIDILKSGHHGAINTINEKMLKELNPKFIVLSVGFNTYGHPNPETLDIIELSNSNLLTTKSSGAIKFIYEKDKLSPYEFKKGKFISPIKENTNLPLKYKNLRDEFFKETDKDFN